MVWHNTTMCEVICNCIKIYNADVFLFPNIFSHKTVSLYIVYAHWFTVGVIAISILLVVLSRLGEVRLLPALVLVGIGAAGVNRDGWNKATAAIGAIRRGAQGTQVYFPLIHAFWKVVVASPDLVELCVGVEAGIGRKVKVIRDNGGLNGGMARRLVGCLNSYASQVTMDVLLGAVHRLPRGISIIVKIVPPG